MTKWFRKTRAFAASVALVAVALVFPAQALAARPQVKEAKVYQIGQKTLKVETAIESRRVVERTPRIPDQRDFMKMVKGEKPQALAVPLRSDLEWADAIVLDGRYAYLGLNTDREDGHAQIVKIDPVRMQEVTTLELTQGWLTRIHALTSVGSYLVHGSNTNPAIFTVVDQRTMKEVGDPLVGEIIDGPAPNDKFIRPVITIGDFVYAGCNSEPGKVVKLRLDKKDGDLARIGSITFEAGEDSVSSLVFDGKYIYAGLETSPARIIKIDPVTMKRVASVTLNADEVNLDSLAYGDGHLFAGCYGSPADTRCTEPVKVVKVNAASMQRVASYTGDAGDIGTRAAFYDGAGDRLFVGTWTGPARVLKIDPVTMKKQATLDLSTVLNPKTNQMIQVNYTSWFVKDGNDLLTCTDSSPGLFVRLIDVLGKKANR